jgi:hypothetical protein
MTRKDYKVIAGAINDVLTTNVLTEDQRFAIAKVTQTLGRELQRDNGRFDYGRFLGAVMEGVNPTEPAGI